MPEQTLEWAQKNGYDVGQKWRDVFTVRDDVTDDALTTFAVLLAESWGTETARLGLKYGAAFVRGAVDALKGAKRSPQSMSLEEKIDALLTLEIRRSEPKALDSGGHGDGMPPT